MRFSAVAALCAVPLVLAGTLHQDLIAREALGLEVARSEDKSGEKSSGGNNNNNNNNSNQKNSGNDDKVVVVQQQSTDVILIWVNQGNGAATQTVTDTVTVTQAAGATGTEGAAAAVATHQVTVGGAAGLVYTPDTLSANPGDMVVFTFQSKNHTVTQSAFDTPCKKIADGFDSGFMANPNDTITPPPQMGFQVTTASPVWFYCRQAGHCGQGMTFSINPTANKTQADFKQLAIQQNGTGTASPITGGAPASAAPPPPPPASTVAPPPPATTAAPAAAASGSMAVGNGVLVDNGACNCACLCSTGSFPNAAVQGIGAFGGLPGAMPMSALSGA